MLQNIISFASDYNCLFIKGYPVLLFYAVIVAFLDILQNKEVPHITCVLAAINISPFLHFEVKPKKKHSL